MEKQMYKNTKIVLLLAILIIVALGTAIWASYAYFKPFSPFSPQPPSPNQGNPPPSQGIAGDLEVFYVAEAVVSSLNIALLVFLLVSNADIFHRTRSKFTFGLLIFSAAFLVKDLTSSPLVIWVFGYHQQGLGPFAFVPDLFEFVVLCALLYISFE